MGKLIREAKADAKLLERAKKRADAYLKIPGTRLETTEDFFVYSFLLDDLFRVLMQKAGTNLITVNSCMGAIMPASETTACLTLSTLNDDGYLAFCESDFVAIPAGVLLGNISGKPVFLCNPNFPHDNIITVAHCTAPRKMDGKNYDPARIVTHFESDYGAAPYVEAPLGTTTTHVAAGFSTRRWVGLKGTIVDVPFRPICRTQFDIRYEFPDMLLAERVPGFHWITCFGDYRKEVGYALRRAGVEWENLDEIPTKPM
jgi:L-fucose isomerase-like protein